ncbi:MAG: ABC transporter substrate-binding protein [Lysobacteraceae bacterium]
MLIRFVLASLLAGLALSATAQDTPGALVEARTKAVVSTLAAQRAEFRADPAKLSAYVREQLETLFDREYSARLVLARHARSASEAQITAFADALTENLLRRYGDALLEVEGDLGVRIRAETPLRDGKMMRVSSEITRPGQPSVPIDYLFARSADGWRVFDVIVEGVSYVQTYRAQFDALLRTRTLDEVTRGLVEGTVSVDE